MVLPQFSCLDVQRGGVTVFVRCRDRSPDHASFRDRRIKGDCISLGLDLVGMMDKERIKEIKSYVSRFKYIDTGELKDSVFFRGANGEPHLFLGKTSEVIADMVTEINYLLDVIEEQGQELKHIEEKGATVFKTKTEQVGIFLDGVKIEGMGSWTLLSPSEKEFKEMCGEILSGRYNQNDKVTVTVPRGLYDEIVVNMKRGQDVKIVCEDNES